MPLKKYKPVTPTNRYKTTLDYSVLSNNDPHRPLLKAKNNKAGRGSQNRISVRRRGGGHKRLYRVIDFKRNKLDIEGRVATIEYDPNRSANIALIVYNDGEKRYMLAPYGLQVGDTVVAGEKAAIKVGNALPLAKIPTGVAVHNVELHPGKGGQMVRGAGAVAQLLGKEGKYVLLKLPSGETRRVLASCYATIGQIGNRSHSNVTIGKAGRSRWAGKRPHVRGVVMNPVDHPHGGGEGRTSGGRHPVSPSGLPTKGFKTRSQKKYSNKFIIKKRK